ENLSNIKFRIGNAYAWDAGTNEWSQDQIRPADFYIFCILQHTDPETVNPLHLKQWTFLVLSTNALNEHCSHQETITLAILRRIPRLSQSIGDSKISIRRGECDFVQFSLSREAVLSKTHVPIDCNTD
ncbi:MAG TPA: hypothetical protein VKA68_00345, partial [bacterium]|nr:hypothetical protein [bacterium]